MPAIEVPAAHDVSGLGQGRSCPEKPCDQQGERMDSSVDGETMACAGAAAGETAPIWRHRRKQHHDIHCLLSLLAGFDWRTGFRDGEDGRRSKCAACKERR